MQVCEAPHRSSHVAARDSEPYVQLTDCLAHLLEFGYHAQALCHQLTSAPCAPCSQVNVMGDFVASLPDELNATSLHLLQPR